MAARQVKTSVRAHALKSGAPARARALARRFGAASGADAGPTVAQAATPAPKAIRRLSVKQTSAPDGRQVVERAQ